MIPPLSADEYRQLEENILAEGIRDPLVVWEVPNGDMILLDGHNRFEIAAKHGGIHFEVKKMHFSDHDRERAKAWMLQNQLGRRNISLYDRGVLALKLKPLIQAEAKKNERKGGGSGSSGRQKSDNPVDTKKELARIAQTSHDTIRKVELIEEKGSDDLKKQVRSGDKSINQAWLEIKERDRRQADLSAKAHLEAAEERHKDFQNAITVSIEEVKQDKEDASEIAFGKSRELKNALKGILFIGASLSGKDNSFSIISKKTVGNTELQNLIDSITRAINVLTDIRKTIER